MVNNSVLIINGVESINELSVFGIELAKKYHDAERIYLVSKDGKVKQVKYKIGEPIGETWFYNVEGIVEKV